MASQSSKTSTLNVDTGRTYRTAANDSKTSGITKIISASSMCVIIYSLKEAEKRESLSTRLNELLKVNYQKTDH